MDKAIAPSVISRQRRKQIFLAACILTVLVAAIFLLRASIAPTLTISAITTAVVETGAMENTITASGEILPEFEEIIASTIDASIQEVLVDAGTPVKAGQSLLKLDKSAAETAYEKMKFGLKSRQNELQKLQLELNKGYYDIRSNNSIKELRINSLQADVDNAKRLYKAGGGTREDVEKASLNLKVAGLEKLQLENEIKSKQQTMQVEMREARIATSIQQNDLRELARKLQLANIVAKRDGVVTWINKNIGAVVTEGESLVRIADLSSFKVQGSISDSYLNQLKNGMPALFRINETQVRGTVTNIQPSVQNGIVTFNIQLEQQHDKLLRPNMKVDVYLVTAAKPKVLRVANGPAFNGAATQDIFVVQEGKAVRRKVAIGMTNFDHVELNGDIKKGEIVITSDMSSYQHASEIKINN